MHWNRYWNAAVAIPETVVTDVGGTAELIDGNGLVVPWADPAGIAAALRRLIGDPEARRRMGKRSREIASGFAWGAIADRYIDLFRRTAHAGRLQAPARTPAETR